MEEKKYVDNNGIEYESYDLYLKSWIKRGKTRVNNELKEEIELTECAKEFIAACSLFCEDAVKDNITKDTTEDFSVIKYKELGERIKKNEMFISDIAKNNVLYLLKTLDRNVSNNVYARAILSVTDILYREVLVTFSDAKDTEDICTKEPVKEEIIAKENSNIFSQLTNIKAVIPDESIVNEKYKEVYTLVQANEPVFLTGPAGSGKNVMVKQIADAMGLKFYFTNAVTQEYKITGYQDAVGTYHETQFYKAFTEGGLFMLDEMDASIPEVLVILNAAIANRYFDFPIGYRDAHPDFRVVAAGNTQGLGADAEYVGRNQLDAASLDRFSIVPITYDPKIDLLVANNNRGLVAFAKGFRHAADATGIKCICSYRAINRISKLEETLGTVEAIKISLTKSLERDDINMLFSKFPYGTTDNRYYKALRVLAQKA